MADKRKIDPAMRDVVRGHVIQHEGLMKLAAEGKAPPHAEKTQRSSKMYGKKVVKRG